MAPEDLPRIPPQVIEACQSGDGARLQSLVRQGLAFDTQAYARWQQAFRRDLQLPDCRESTIIRQLVGIAARHRHEAIVEYLLCYGRLSADRVASAVELGSGAALEFFISLDPFLPRRARYHFETYMNVGLPLPEWKAMLGIETLLQHGGDPNRPFPLMRAAIRTGNPRLVALIDAYGGQPDKATLIRGAAATGSVDLVRYLVGCGADVNCVGDAEDRWTALHEAAHRGDLPMVDLLLTYGAHPAILGTAGETPLDVADPVYRSAVQERLARAGVVGLEPSGG